MLSLNHIIVTIHVKIQHIHVKLCKDYAHLDSRNDNENDSRYHYGEGYEAFFDPVWRASPKDPTPYN